MAISLLFGLFVYLLGAAGVHVGCVYAVQYVNMSGTGPHTSQLINGLAQAVLNRFGKQFDESLVGEYLQLFT